MSTPIRAVYHDGQLSLLDAVALAKGQEVHLISLGARYPCL
ncbi:MAG: antitoxin family protein [Armatimonadetes bacterium]|nr:antitoxin family protein [Anaerolineae bacterium]